MPVTQVVWSYEIFAIRARRCRRRSWSLWGGTSWRSSWATWREWVISPDRLELPFLDQLRSDGCTKMAPGFFRVGVRTGKSCLVAWWQAGVLCNLSLVNLPEDDTRGGVFQSQVKQMVWSGELEGWLTTERVFIWSWTRMPRPWKPGDRCLNWTRPWKWWRRFRLRNWRPHGAAGRAGQ